MESLAVVAVLVLLAIFGSAFIAFGLSWVQRPWGKPATFVLAGIAAASGLWIGYTLTPGNGIFIATIPIAVAAFSVWNAMRRSR